MTRPRRHTEMTSEQRRVLEQVRLMLVPHFPGEQVRLHIPKKDEPAAALRIAEALRAGEDPRTISRREDVSLSWIRKIRARVIGRIGRGTLPP